MATRSPVGLTGLAIAKERAHPGNLRDHELPVFLSTIPRQLNRSPYVIGQVEAMEVAEANLDSNRRLPLYINVEDLGFIEVISTSKLMKFWK